MTSRVSFWNSIKEDLKRRNWLLALTSLVLFFAYPVRFALYFDGIKNDWERGYHNEISGTVTEHLQKFFMSGLALDQGMTIIVVIIAFVCGIQGFAYLYKKQKVDMFYSVPVSKGKRFATVYLNGIIIFGVAYLVNLLLAFIVAVASGALSAQAIGVALTTFAIYLIIFLTIYNITIVAVMMTGNLVVTFLATAVFFLYEMLIYGMISMLQSVFFVSYSYYSQSFEEKLLTTPIFGITEMVDGVSVTGQSVVTYGTSFGSGLIHIAIIAVITGVLAFYLHGKRPAEASERAMAFTKSKTPIKFLISVPICVFAGAMFYVSTNDNIGFLVFGLALGVVLSHCMFEVIYEFDIRAVWNHKRQMVFSSGINACVFWCVCVCVCVCEWLCVVLRKILHKLGILMMSCQEAFHQRKRETFALLS